LGNWNINALPIWCSLVRKKLKKREAKAEYRAREMKK